MVQSRTKTSVDHQTAAAIVEAAFGANRSLVSIAACEEGWFNAVYRLELSDDTACILKVAPPPAVPVLRYEHNIISTEVEALRLVRERTDVPVPGVLVWDDSCELVPSPYFLMEPCRGELLSIKRPALDLDAQRRVDDQVLRHVASINSITDGLFGRPDPSATRDPSWGAAFERLVTDVLVDAAEADVELPLPGDAFASIVEEHRPYLDVVTTPRLVHWDLGDPNVFIDESWTVVGIIDFERVLWADPLIEAQFVGKRVGDRATDIYVRPLFDEPHAAARRRLYDLYLFLVMTVECAYRNYPTDDIERFARRSLGAVIDEI